MQRRPGRHLIERPRTREGGFTFIELVLALAILASSMTIFIGLQAAAVQRNMHDQNVQQAMLAARRLMAMIDTLPTILEQGNIPPTPVTDLLNQFGVPLSTTPTEQEALSRLQASLNVEMWNLPVPNIDENPLRKITLAVGWGPDPAEKFELVYYIPTDET